MPYLEKGVVEQVNRSKQSLMGGTT